MAVERTFKLTVMLSDEEQKMLERVATRRGLSSSDLVRRQVRDLEAADTKPLDNLQRSVMNILSHSGPKDPEWLVNKLRALDYGPKEIPRAIDALFTERCIERDGRDRLQLTERGRTFVW